MDCEWTSFIRIRHVNQRRDPMAHSRAFLECLRIFLSCSVISGPSSKDCNDRSGNHMSPENHTSGLAVGVTKQTRDLNFFRRMEENGSMSYDLEPFQI